MERRPSNAVCLIADYGLFSPTAASRRHRAFLIIWCCWTLLSLISLSTGWPQPDFKSSKQKVIVKRMMTGYWKQDPPTLVSFHHVRQALNYSSTEHGMMSKRNPADKPTEVRLGIYVNSFYSINEQTMDYSVNFYLRQAWYDPRLAFNPPDGALDVDEIKMDEGMWTKIWLPDTFFRNEKEASYHDDYSVNLYLRQTWRDPRLVFVPFGNHVTTMRIDGGDGWQLVWIPDTFFRNEKRSSFHEVTVRNRLLRLNATGHLWYVIKISATLSCPMKLHKYPLDTQRCPMMFESFGYTMDTMYFTWIDNPVDVDKSLQLPQFFLVDRPRYDCSRNYTGGAFPCLSIHFVLRRDLGFFLIQVYVPSILIVILSWVSFWINIDASPARVSLGLLTVLTTTTMSAGARESLPRVSYIKAIDVWMIICLVFVFASLIEYAVVNVAARHGLPVRTTTASVSSGPTGGSNVGVVYRPRTARSATGNSHWGAAGDHSGENGFATTVGNMFDRLLDLLKIRPLRTGEMERMEPVGKAAPVDMEAGKRRARSIDKLSRKCFPIAFIIFNIVYWIVYTWPEATEKDEDGMGDSI